MRLLRVWSIAVVLCLLPKALGAAEQAENKGEKHAGNPLAAIDSLQVLANLLTDALQNNPEGLRKAIHPAIKFAKAKQNMQALAMLDFVRIWLEENHSKFHPAYLGMAAYDSTVFEIGLEAGAKVEQSLNPDERYLAFALGSIYCPSEDLDRMLLMAQALYGDQLKDLPPEYYRKRADLEAIGWLLQQRAPGLLTLKNVEGLFLFGRYEGGSGNWEIPQIEILEETILQAHKKGLNSIVNRSAGLLVFSRLKPLGLRFDPESKTLKFVGIKPKRNRTTIIIDNAAYHVLWTNYQKGEPDKDRRHMMGKVLASNPALLIKGNGKIDSPSLLAFAIYMNSPKAAKKIVDFMMHYGKKRRFTHFAMECIFDSAKPIIPSTPEWEWLRKLYPQAKDKTFKLPSLVRRKAASAKGGEERKGQLSSSVLGF